MAARTDRRRFALALAVIALLALTVRIAFVFGEANREDEYLYDSLFYTTEARALAQGYGFVEPVQALRGEPAGPAADHPPVTVLVLAPVAKLFPDHVLPMRLLFAALGTASVVLIGLLAERVGRSSRVGIIAALIAALYPYLWVNDGLIMSETPTLLLVVLVLICTYRLLDRPSWQRALVLGAVCGVAALTRAELVLLPPMLAAGIAFSLRHLSVRRGLALGAVVIAATMVVVSPWAVYNLSRFHEPVLISTNGELAFRGVSCDQAFYGPQTGLVGINKYGGASCVPLERPAGDQSQVGAEYRRQALDYTSSHLRRYVVVVLARAGRTWSLFRPWDMVELNEGEGRPSWVTATGLFVYYPLLGLAVAGGVILRRRRLTLWPLLLAPVIVTLTALVTLGLTRYRVPAEPSLVVLAAITIDALVRKTTTGREPTPGGAVSPPPGPRDPGDSTPGAAQHGSFSRSASIALVTADTIR